MTADPLILGFDTSAAHCAAALLRGDQVLAEITEEMSRGQAERLVPLLQRVLDGAGVTWGDLDAVAVGTGPGNFTGIRISVAAARGLALGLGIPAIGVTAFEALSAGQHRAGPCLLSLPSSRRGADVVVQVLSETGADGPPRELSLSESLDHIAPLQGLAVHGAMAQPLHELLNADRQDVPAPQTLALADVGGAAIALTRAAVGKFRLGEKQGRPAPLYVRAADAAPPRDAPPVILA